MVSAATVVGYLVIVVIHTVIAAVGARFFRLRMKTEWGSVVYTLLLVPLALVVSTLVLSGVLGLGGPIGSRDTALLLVVVVPLTLGYSIDLFWMPAPEDLDLPDRDRRQERS